MTFIRIETNQKGRILSTVALHSQTFYRIRPPGKEMNMASQKTSSRRNAEKTTAQMDVAIHRRILNFLNEAIQPADLIYEKLPPPNPEMDHDHEERDIHEITRQGRKQDRRRILDPEIATEIIA